MPVMVTAAAGGGEGARQGSDSDIVVVGCARGCFVALIRWGGCALLVFVVVDGVVVLAMHARASCPQPRPGSERAGTNVRGTIRNAVAQILRQRHGVAPRRGSGEKAACAAG
jgi:hypothetical protein